MKGLLLHNLIKVLFTALYKTKTKFDIKTYNRKFSKTLHLFLNLNDLTIPEVAQVRIKFASTILVSRRNDLFDGNSTNPFTLLKKCGYVITRKWVRFMSNASLPDEILVYNLRGS